MMELNLIWIMIWIWINGVEIMKAESLREKKSIGIKKFHKLVNSTENVFNGYDDLREYIKSLNIINVEQTLKGVRL